MPQYALLYFALIFEWYLPLTTCNFFRWTDCNILDLHFTITTKQKNRDMAKDILRTNIDDKKQKKNAFNRWQWLMLQMDDNMLISWCETMQAPIWNCKVTFCSSAHKQRRYYSNKIRQEQRKGHDHKIKENHSFEETYMSPLQLPWII